MSTAARGAPGARSPTVGRELLVVITALCLIQGILLVLCWRRSGRWPSRQGSLLLAALLLTPPLMLVVGGLGTLLGLEQDGSLCRSVPGGAEAILPSLALAESNTSRLVGAFAAAAGYLAVVVLLLSSAGMSSRRSGTALERAAKWPWIVHGLALGAVSLLNGVWVAAVMAALRTPITDARLASLAPLIATLELVRAIEAAAPWAMAAVVVSALVVILLMARPSDLTLRSALAPVISTLAVLVAVAALNVALERRAVNRWESARARCDDLWRRDDISTPASDAEGLAERPSGIELWLTPTGLDVRGGADRFRPVASDERALHELLQDGAPREAGRGQHVVLEVDTAVSAERALEVLRSLQRAGVGEVSLSVRRSALELRRLLAAQQRFRSSSTLTRWLGDLIQQRRYLDLTIAAAADPEGVVLYARERFAVACSRWAAPAIVQRGCEPPADDPISFFHRFTNYDLRTALAVHLTSASGTPAVSLVHGGGLEVQTLVDVIGAVSAARGEEGEHGPLLLVTSERDGGPPPPSAHTGRCWKRGLAPEAAAQLCGGILAGADGVIGTRSRRQ